MRVLWGSAGIQRGKLILSFSIFKKWHISHSSKAADYLFHIFVATAELPGELSSAWWTGDLNKHKAAGFTMCIFFS